MENLLKIPLLSLSASSSSYVLPAVSILAALPISIVAVTLLERFLNAIFFTVWYLLFGLPPKFSSTTKFTKFTSNGYSSDDGEDDSSAAHVLAGLQFIASSLAIVNRIVSTIVNVLLQSLSGVVSWSFTFAILFFVTGLIYLSYEEYPVIARGFGKQYNAYMGPQLHAVLVVPLDLLTQLIKIFLPLYNTFVWLSTALFTNSLLPPLLKAPDKILQALTATSYFARTSIGSLTVYIDNTFATCTTPESSSTCVADVGLRTIDLITPMSHVRQIVGIVLSWVALDVCMPLGALLDVLLYPLTDINFAKAVHNLINSALWIFLQVPIVTVARCQLFKAELGPIMCVPDFDPALQFFMEGLRKAGNVVDNWLNIFLLVMESIVHPAVKDTCSASSAAISPLSALLLDTDEEKQVQAAMFGSNFTTVVGLTETLFAMTDGVGIIYYSTETMAMRSMLSPNAWPIAVDPRMGIAAVRYAKEDLFTTAMMGCRYALHVAQKNL